MHTLLKCLVLATLVVIVCGIVLRFSFIAAQVPLFHMRRRKVISSPVPTPLMTPLPMTLPSVEFVYVDCFRSAVTYPATLTDFDDDEDASEVAGAHLHASRLALEAQVFSNRLASLPKIAIAQQNEEDFLERPESVTSSLAIPRQPLSAITERTEVTDEPATPIQLLQRRSLRSSMSSNSTSTYGQVIGKCFSCNHVVVFSDLPGKQSLG